MTEAVEATPENIEYLRARLRELKAKAREELEQLRRDRDKMREYKAIRDEHNKEVRALIESVKAEREARDKINEQIREAKERRSAIHQQLKAVYDEIRELRGKIVGSPSSDQRRMMKRVEELEWRQQTESLTIEEERAIVEEIARIEAKLVKIGQEKEKQDRISELRRLARRLKKEASEIHQQVLELSEQSQVHHQEVVKIRPQLEEFKRLADTAHKNFVEWLKKVKAGEERLKALRSEIDEIYKLIRKYESEHRGSERSEKRAKQKAEEQDRVDAAVEKLQAGKRLTFDEFILAQKVVTAEKKAKRRKKKEADEAESDSESTVSDNTTEEAVSPETAESTTEPETVDEQASEESVTEATETSEEPPAEDTEAED